MRILPLLLIAMMALGGVVHACADAHPDHADLACLDNCCQPVSPAHVGPTLTAGLVVCERLRCAGGCLNDDPLARSHFRPPEAA